MQLGIHFHLLHFPSGSDTAGNLTETNGTDLSARDELSDELANDFQRKVRTTEIKNAIEILNSSDGEGPKNVTEHSEDISETSRFVLASICAISMNQLFEKTWDADFCSRSIKLILANLQLSSNVRRNATHLPVFVTKIS